MMPDPQPRRYTFKLYPRPCQEAALDLMLRLHCDLYNAALEERALHWWRPQWRLGDDGWKVKRHLSYFDQSRWLPALRAADARYAALSSKSLEWTLRRLDKAWKAGRRRQPVLAAAWRQRGEGPPPPKIKPGDWAWACRIVGDAIERGRPLARRNGNPLWMPRFQRADDYRGFDFGEHGNGWNIALGESSPGRPRNGRVYFKGVPATVRLRGRLPVAPAAIVCATVRRDGGCWWLSLVVAQHRARAPGVGAGRVTFDLIDRFATVERLGAAGVEAEPIAAPIVPADDLSLDAIRAARDRCARGSRRHREHSRRLARLSARLARQRREALHEWTTDIQRRFADLEIVAPDSIAAETRSARGSERDPGAAVKGKATVNRAVLAQAPAATIAMLEYKIAEAGGACARVAATAPGLSAAGMVPAAVKSARRARRAARKQRKAE